MKNIYAVILITLIWAVPVCAAPLNVVASLSTFADLVEQIGGEHVEVSYIAPPSFNPHFIEPKPSDVLRVKKANLFVYTGVDLEVWSDPLLVAAANPDVRAGGKGHLRLSAGIHMLEVPDAGVTRAEGDIHAYGNPHFWHSPENVGQMVKIIAAKLTELDPDHAEDYAANLKRFQERLLLKTSEWKAQMKPFKGTEFIGYHNEWPYLMAFIECRMTEFLESKPGIPPGPKQLNELTQHAKQHTIAGIVHTSFMPTRPSATLSKRTGVPVVTLAQNVGEQKAATDYFALMDYNLEQLLTVLQGN